MLAGEAWGGCSWHLVQHAVPAYHALLRQLESVGAQVYRRDMSMQAQTLHISCNCLKSQSSLASAAVQFQGQDQHQVCIGTVRVYTTGWTNSNSTCCASTKKRQRSGVYSQGANSGVAGAGSIAHPAASRTAATHAAAAAAQVQSQQAVDDSRTSNRISSSSSPSGYLAAARAVVRHAPDAPGTPQRPVHAPYIAARHHLQQYLASIDRMGFVEDLAAGIWAGNRLAISRALTLCESTRPDHALQAAALLRTLIDNRHQQQQQQQQGLASTNSSGASRSMAGQPGAIQGSSSLQQLAAAALQPHPSLQTMEQAAATAAADSQAAPGISSSNSLHTKSLRVGLSGPPGAGKSSLIEAWGCYLADHGSKVAVLAVDPSSVETGGAILGDKTRMARLSSHPNAFVRPSPARGTLGGVSRATYDAMVICEAAGYDKVLVETVGVGQSEVAVADLVDCMLLVMPPVGGDDLQMIKRGIMEVADVVLVNKADGATEAAATRAAAEYGGCLRLMPHRYHGWSPQVLAVSAHTGRGVPALARMVAQFQQALTDSGELQKSRIRRAESITWLSLEEQLLESLRQDPHTKALMARLMPCVRAGTMAPRSAADIALSYFYQHCS